MGNLWGWTVQDFGEEVAARGFEIDPILPHGLEVVDLRWRGVERERRHNAGAGVCVGFSVTLAGRGVARRNSAY